MNNGTDPVKMTLAERLDEVAMLLAAGFLRLRARRIGKPEKRDISEIRRDNCLAVPLKNPPCVVNP